MTTMARGKIVGFRARKEAISHDRSVSVCNVSDNGKPIPVYTIRLLITVKSGSSRNYAKFWNIVQRNQLRIVPSAKSVTDCGAIEAIGTMPKTGKPAILVYEVEGTAVKMRSETGASIVHSPFEELLASPCIFQEGLHGPQAPLNIAAPYGMAYGSGPEKRVKQSKEYIAPEKRVVADTPQGIVHTKYHGQTTLPYADAHIQDWRNRPR